MKIRIKKDSEPSIEILSSENVEDIAKSKDGAMYTQGKVKILRPVKLDNGSIFQRNYWVDPTDVKDDDVLLDKDKKGADTTVMSEVKNLFLGTQNREINTSTYPASVKENARNFLSEIFEKFGEEYLDEAFNRNTADQVKKLALINAKLADKTLTDELKTQLVELKSKVRGEISPIFHNAEKIHKVFPYIKQALFAINLDKNSTYPIENYIPTWLDTVVEMRKSKNITGAPQFNYETMKLELNLEGDFDPQNYNNAIGHKIEEKNPEIKNLCKEFLKERDFDFNIRGQNFINKEQDSKKVSTKTEDVPRPLRVDYLKNIYPHSNYTTEIGYGWDYVDPHIGQFYPNTDHTNLFADGLQLFMKDSAFKNIFILDRGYAEFIVGILVSNIQSEKKGKK